MGIIEHTIDDGDGRYASRTRVNRLVYQFDEADLASNPMVESAKIPINGEIHTIKLDVGMSLATTQSDVETTKGQFSMVNGDFFTMSGSQENLFTPIGGVDFTGQNPETFYQFQTNEGAAQNGTTMDIALSVRTGLSGHSTPAAPNVADAGGTPRVVGSVQPWTGRVCGSVKFVLQFLSANTFHTSTGPIRVIVYYS
jgi:hypothetical protein